VPLGVLAAVKRGSFADQIVRVIGLIGYSVPIFWLALISLVIFYAQAALGGLSRPHRHRLRIHLHADHRLLSARQRHAGAMGRLLRCLPHIILPASLLGYFSLAYISRMTRSFMLNELARNMSSPRAPRACRKPESSGAMRCAMRRAAGHGHRAVLCGLLEGSVLTETVFSWPGIGLYITNSLQNADMNAVLGGTIVIGTVFIGINLLSDLLYRTARPEDAKPMSSRHPPSPMSRRAWLLSDRPQSRTQAASAAPTSPGGSSPQTGWPWSASDHRRMLLLIAASPMCSRRILPSSATCATLVCCRPVRGFLLGTDDQGRDIYSR
jgi:ABC-type antimicrobial peptide transport system permease subunit